MKLITPNTDQNTMMPVLKAQTFLLMSFPYALLQNNTGRIIVTNEPMMDPEILKNDVRSGITRDIKNQKIKLTTAVK